MENATSFRAVEQSCFTPQFIRPLYESYCFSRLPQTIINLLTHQEQPALPSDVLSGLAGYYDTIILFFIDGFGWRFLEQALDKYPFLQHFARHGVISKLTAQFPSTTAAHVTTIHTGLAPAQSGVYEWFQHEPLLNRIIAPLMFTYAGEPSRDTLPASGYNVASLFPNHTIYQHLAARGVHSHVFQSSLYAHSIPSEHLLSGAQIVAYKTYSEGLIRLSKLMEVRNTPSYFMLYFGDIDSISHIYGPDSAEVQAEIDTFLVTMERLLLDRMIGKQSRTLLLLTADHGQTAIDPATTIYLNRQAQLRGLRRYLNLGEDGEPLIPAGSPRDLFLHVKQDSIREAVTLLQECLDGKALVVPIEELIRQGFFGPQDRLVTEQFLKRAGNVVILPYAGESVYWYERGKFEQHFYGHHGGLTRDEMEIPLLACDL